MIGSVKIRYWAIAAAALILTANDPGLEERMAAAEEVGAFEFADRQALDDAELEEQRGGFQWQGLTVNLGADIRTYLNGQLALRTLVSWTPQGATKDQFVSGTLTQADAAQIQAGVLSSGGITMRVGQETVFLANQGQTAIIHRTDGSFQNILVNTASNTQLSQEIDATLDLGGYNSFAADLAQDRLALNLGAALSQAAVGSLGD